MIRRAADEVAAADGHARTDVSAEVADDVRAAKRAKVLAPLTLPPETVNKPADSWLVSDESSLHSDGEGSVSTAASLESFDAASNVANASLRPPLRYSFSGYSIWLDLEQSPLPNAPEVMNDLDAAIAFAAKRQKVNPIPAPHVTVVYGISHLAEREVRSRFATLKGLIDNMGGWPDLLAKGVLVDKEYDGVDGGTMSMAWMEMTLATSPEHEALIDAVHNTFHQEADFDSSEANGITTTARSEPWKPHLSLCYDNPEDSPFNLSGAMEVVSKFPSLLSNGRADGGGRRPVGLSIWKTEGTMGQWECLDRFTFR